MEPSESARSAPPPPREDSPRGPCRPCCPACGGPLVEIKAKLVCSRCRTICETCCEGGPG